MYFVGTFNVSTEELKMKSTFLSLSTVGITNKRKQKPGVFKSRKLAEITIPFVISLSLDLLSVNFLFKT